MRPDDSGSKAWRDLLPGAVRSWLRYRGGAQDVPSMALHPVVKD